MPGSAETRRALAQATSNLLRAAYFFGEADGDRMSPADRENRLHEAAIAFYEATEANTAALEAELPEPDIAW